MIPYPHDTTGSVEGIGQVIEPSAFLDGRRIAPRRGFVFGALLVALCLHGYAWAVLPNAMEIDFEEAPMDYAELINDEIGNDPDVATNYNVDRIEEVNVPTSPMVDRIRAGTAPVAEPATADELARMPD